MYLLDTNVISEYLRLSKRNQNVVDWFGQVADHQLYTSTIVKAELLYGIAIAKFPAQKRNLTKAVGSFFDEVLIDRVFSFTDETAAHYAIVAASRQQSGLAVSQLDMAIAAIAHEHGLTVVTRNITDFEGAGVDIINPFEPQTE